MLGQMYLQGITRHSDKYSLNFPTHYPVASLKTEDRNPDTASRLYCHLVAIALWNSKAWHS